MLNKNITSKILYLSFIILCFVSCKEDDLSWKNDIDTIKKELASQKQELANQRTIIEAIKNSAIITDINYGEESYTISFSNGQTVTLYNGVTPIVTIGDNGNWFINGEDTGKPSQGDFGMLGFGGTSSTNTTVPILTSIIEKEDSFVFYFSDGTSATCAKYNKKPFRILCIGNSYTIDVTHHLKDIVEAAGIETSNIGLYRATRSSASFKTWYDCFCDKDDCKYKIEKVLGGIDIKAHGEGDYNNGKLFRNALCNNKWDLIILNQCSAFAPYYQKYNGWKDNSEGGYLNELMWTIKKYQPQAKIGFMLIHSYASFYKMNKEESAYERWKLIAESTKQFLQDNIVDFVIPYGTAIQNLRASSLNNEFDLTEEGTHCSSGIADYTAACCFFQSVFAPIYGISILGNKCRIKTSDPYSIDVTDKNAAIAQKAAFSATYNMFNILNPEQIDIK